VIKTICTGDVNGSYASISCIDSGRYITPYKIIRNMNMDNLFSQNNTVVFCGL